MDSLLLANQTRLHLSALLVDPPHALLLVGPTGTGKHSIATAWAAQLTAPEHVATIYPDDKMTISIETVRGLYRFTRTKQDKHQVVIIDNAQAMGIEAQNAFLKLLEEPHQGVTFILTAPTAEALLPTITSRTQALHIGRVSNAALQQLASRLNSALSAQELTQILFVADGRPAVVASLANDPAVFEAHKQTMQRAKQLLSASTYERLAQITELTKDRTQLVQVLEALGHMLELQIMHDPKPKLLRFAEKLEECLTRLAQNGNPRAQLTALFSAQ